MTGARIPRCVGTFRTYLGDENIDDVRNENLSAERRNGAERRTATAQQLCKCNCCCRDAVCTGAAGVSTITLARVCTTSVGNRSDHVADGARSRNVGVRVGDGQLAGRLRCGGGRARWSRGPGGHVQRERVLPEERGQARRAVGTGAAREGERDRGAGRAREPVHGARATGRRRDRGRGPVRPVGAADEDQRDGGHAGRVRGGRGARRARVHRAQARFHAGAGAARADRRGPGRGGRAVRDPVAGAHGPTGRGQAGRARAPGAGGGRGAQPLDQAAVAARGPQGQRAARPGLEDVRSNGEAVHAPGHRPRPILDGGAGAEARAHRGRPTPPARAAVGCERQGPGRVGQHRPDRHVQR